MMRLDLFIVLFEGVIVAVSCYLMYRPRSRLPKSLPRAAPGPPFDAAAYLARMEDAYLSMLAAAQPVDQTITLWLGLDGFRIDPDGTAEWIRREPFQTAPPPLICVSPWESGRLNAPPLPLHWLPTPPPPGIEVLYADNQAVLACCADSEAYMRGQLNSIVKNKSGE